MVLTRSELVGSLQHEVRILVHLASKVDRDRLDYRPTPKQRSTLELLQYLSVMGPEMVKAAKRGGFDPAVWSAVEEASRQRDFDQTIAVIAAQADDYPKQLEEFSDAEFREEVSMFGHSSTKGAFLVNTVLCGYAAYRTQLFNYLKACGREEMTTSNLWAGVDAQAKTA
jgi:hypothetical protein